MAWWNGKLIQDLFALASGEAVSKIAGFFAFAYLARTLGPEGYGMVELAVSLSVFFAIAIDFGYGSIGAREAARNRDCAADYAKQIVSARLILTLFSIPLMGLIGFYTSQSETSSKLIWIFSIGLLAAPWNHRWLMQGLEKMNLVALGQVIRMLVFTLGVFLFVNSIEDIISVGYIEAVAAACMATSYLIMQTVLVGIPHFDFHPKRFFAISKEAISVGLSQVVWALNQYIPVFLISALTTPTQLALFASVHRITSSLVGFSLLYHFNLFPSVSKKINTSPSAFQDLAKASTHFTAWGGSAVALFITILAEEITVFIFGESFREASTALAIVIWTLPITLLSGHSRWALIASNRQRYVLYAQIGSSVTTVMFCILLIPKYQAIGASIAMVLAALTVWSIAYYFARKHICKIPFLTVMIKPLLFSWLSVMLAWQMNGPLLGIIAAIFLYISLTLLFDRSLLNDIVTLANTKEHLQQKSINITMISTPRILALIFALSLIAFSLLITDLSLAHWLDPIAVGKHLDSLVLGSSFFKSILLVDGLVLLFLFWKKQTVAASTASLWLPKIKQQASSAYLILLSLIFVFSIISHSISITTDLWIDEVLTVVNYVRLNLGQILTNFSSDNQHMLYSALAQISANFFGETPFAVRLPALIFGLGSILAIASLTRYVFGNKEALFSAALLAVSYHHIWFSQNARGYTILLFGSIIATEFMLRGLETKKWRYWVAYALAITIAAWAHLTAVFVAVAHGMVYLGLIIVNLKHDKPFNYWQPLLGFILAAWFTLHVYALSIPQIFEFFNQPGAEPSASTNPVVWTNPLWLINEVLRNLGVGVALGWIGIISACAAGLYGLIHSAKRDALFVWLTLSPALLLGVVMFSLGRNLWPRMFFSEFGFFATIAVVGALGFGQLLCDLLKKQMKLIHYGPILLICVFFALSMPKVYQYPKQDFTAARDYVRQQATNEDTVVAVHMAGKVYRLYYAPEWPEIMTIKELNEHKSKNGYTWVIYTLSGYVESALPALYKLLESDYQQMRTFPGTLGDGALIVLRSKS